MLRAIVQTIPELAWLKDGNGVYLACNSRCQRVFGASEADIVGKSDHELFDRELADAFREHDRQAIAAGTPCEHVLQKAHKCYGDHVQQLFPRAGDLQTLHAEGCEEVQGFLFANPQALETVQGLLAHC